MEYWNIEVLECWSAGVLEYWEIKTEILHPESAGSKMPFGEVKMAERPQSGTWGKLPKTAKGSLDSYRLSFAQIVQNICWHLCKALTNMLLQKSELKSTLSRR